MSTLNILENSCGNISQIIAFTSLIFLALILNHQLFVIYTIVGIIGAFILIRQEPYYSNYLENVDYFTCLYTLISALLLGNFLIYLKNINLKELESSKKKIGELSSKLNNNVSNNTNELKKELQNRSDYLNNLSHEIRTPLQGIIGLSSSLRENWKLLDDAHREEQLETIYESGERLLSLVSNLLDYSKYEAAKMTFDLRQHSLIKAIETAKLQLKPFYYNKKIKIDFLKPSGMNDILAKFDFEKITQVLRNLLSNAIKYSNNKSVEISIMFFNSKELETTYKKASYIGVKVKDNGNGIPETELKDIFRPYQQSSCTNKNTPGTGLGLSISLEIVKKHKGKIWAENNENANGASFIFMIPYEYITEISDNSNANSYKDESNQQKNISPKNKFKVLFVDDEKLCILTAKVILESLSFEVEVAECGGDAIDMINKSKYDLILIDLMMPDMFGTDVLKEVRNNKLNKKTPVIIQSGAADYNEISKAQTLGASGFIIKPYNTNSILEEIKKVLNF